MTEASPVLDEREAALPPAVAAALRGTLPLADPDRASPLGEGWGVIAYRVPDPGGDWAVRVPRGAPFDAVTGDLAREVRLLPLLEAAGLPTPRAARAIFADARDVRPELVEGRTRPGLLAVAHRLIEGEPLTRARLGRGRRRAALAATIADVLTRLHAFPRAEARAAGVPELDLWADRYQAMLAEGRAALGPRSRAWLDETIARFLAAGGMRDAPRTLVHGDIAPAHLLASPPAPLPDREHAARPVAPESGALAPSHSFRTGGETRASARGTKADRERAARRVAPESGAPAGETRASARGTKADRERAARPVAPRISMIDFGDALVADPAIDFGGLLLAYGWPFTEQVLARYGGNADPDFRRRVRFYVDVVPIFLIAFGHLFNDGQDYRDGVRQFAARAAAATRART